MERKKKRDDQKTRKTKKRGRLGEDKRKREYSLVRQLIRECDMTLEVLDARDVLGTLNKRIEMFLNKRNLLLVVNKVDLVSETKKKEISSQLEGYQFVFVNSKDHTCRKLLLEELERFSGGREARVGVVGYPDVGKSSVINLLRRKRVAPVSAFAGFTKNVQWIRVGKFLLIDSPGVFPLSEKGKELLFKSAINPDRLADPTVEAAELIEKFLRKQGDAQKLFEHYEIEPSQDSQEVLERIAVRRGRLLKGGGPDLRTTALNIIRDWQRGKILLEE